MQNRPSSLFALLLLLAAFVWSGCGISLKLPKRTTIQSERPPDYYLGESPQVYVVKASGAGRRMQDAVVRELRNQSRSNGYFTVENRLDEGIDFDVRQGRAAMTGADVSAGEDNVFIKLEVIASMKQDNQTILTRKEGILGTEEERVPAYVTTMPVAFTVTRGRDVLLDQQEYSGKAVWPIDENEGGYPASRYQRYEAAIGQAVKEFLNDVTPRYVSREVQLDYHTDEQQQPILDAALNGQTKEAVTQLEDYVQEHPNSAAAVYNLAVLTDALGQYQQALTYYDKALSLGGKDYYTEAKTACMKRLNEKREMKGASPTPDTAPRTRPAPASENESTSAQPEERPGDSGNDIAWVQRTLNALGHACGVADGRMGPNTRACIRSFQEANGLDVTSKVDEATYRTMLEQR